MFDGLCLIYNTIISLLFVCLNLKVLVFVVMYLMRILRVRSCAISMHACSMGAGSLKSQWGY